MNDQQFDELIKRKLREDPLAVPETQLDQLINQALHKANKPKWKSVRILTAAIIFFGLLSTATILQQRDTEHAKKPQQDTITLENKKEKEPKVVVDIEQEKKKLASEGYVVEPRMDSPEDYTGSSSGLRKYTSTLKDLVYNSRGTIKGKVLGIKYLVQQDTAFTKAKVLIEESYTGPYKKGDIVTVVKAGAIITHYEMIILEGIDQKFNIPEAELEQAKQKMVVHDNMGQMIFPDETMLFFISDIEIATDEINDKAYYLGEPVVKLNEGKILTPETRAIEEGYVFEEFFFTEQLEILEEKIHSVVNEKKNYSQEKAREVAFNYLLEEDKQQVINREEATVRFSTRGTFYNAEKSPENIITVTFKLNSDRYINVVLIEKDYQLFKIVK